MLQQPSRLGGALLSIFFLSIASVAAAGDWPEFRGPGGQGHAAGPNAPLVWSETENIAWKVPLPGHGWSSPVVLGDEIWLTTAITTEANAAEADRRAKGHAASHLPLNVPASVSLRAVCVDRQTGQIRHDVELFNVAWPEPIHATNTHASPTPVVEAGRLYCHFGTWGTACVDTHAAEVVWRADFPHEHYVGPGSSPIVYHDRVILTCDGADQQFIVALDKATGEEIWRQNRPPIRTTNPDFRKSFSTPLVVSAGGGEQIVIPGTQWLVSYDPATGSENWRLEHGDGFSLVPRPVAGNGLVYYCTGFGGTAEVIAVRTDGQGDVTGSHIAWRESGQVPTIPSPILTDGMIFTVSDGGVAMCRDAASGKRLWQQRIGGNFSASPVVVGERLYLFGREGKTTVIAVADEYRELAENELDDAIGASPAVVDGELILRTEDALYRIAERAASRKR
jgi:hypothetical protein